MKWSTLVLAFVFAGCGPAFEYQSSCLSIVSAESLKADRVRVYDRIGARIFESHFGPDTWCQNLEQSGIWVREDYQWEMVGLGLVTGFTNAERQILLGRNGSALLHEAIHVWELRHGVLSTGDHPQWQEKGYFELDHSFGREVTKPENSWLTP